MKYLFHHFKSIILTYISRRNCRRGEVANQMRSGGQGLGELEATARAVPPLLETSSQPNVIPCLVSATPPRPQVSTSPFHAAGP